MNDLRLALRRLRQAPAWTCFASRRGGRSRAVVVLGHAFWCQAFGGDPEVREARRLRDGLVVAQVALSLVLLVGAGLLGRSLQRLGLLAALAANRFIASLLFEVAHIDPTRVLNEG